MPESPQDDHHRHLGRGFNWLGGATVIAKIIDFATILAVLLFLSKQQLGTASLVVAIGVVIEALDGFGTGDALVQAPSVSRAKLDTLFWFILAAALLTGGLTLAAAPLIATLFGIPGLGTYFLAIAAKQPLVGLAVIPMALLNRDLAYERIAMVNLGATLGAALTRLVLAAAGAGAWSLITGFAASGLFIALGAWLACPFRPRPLFRLAEIRPLLRFGGRATLSNLLEQIYRNIDYLLVGWFYGPASLAVYRVAYDIAMEPAQAVGTLVNRTALPVFARLARQPAALAAAIAWALRRLALLAAPPMLLLILAAGPLTALLHDRHGHSYAAAALPLRLLAVAALLRVFAELLYPLMMASGEPAAAARLSAATLGMLTAGILAAGFTFPARGGIIAIAAVWLLIYPPLVAWGALHLRRRGLAGASLLRTPSRRSAPARR